MLKLRQHYDFCLRGGSATYRRNTEASIIRGTDGRLIMAYTRFNDVGHDNAPACIALAWSADEGHSWSDDIAVQDGKEFRNVMEPCLVQLDQGMIGMSFLAKTNNECSQIMFTHSPDNGVSWRRPIIISATDKYTVTLNESMLRTRAGRLIQPIYQTPVGGWVSNEHYKSSCVYSDDQGKTWQSANNWIDCPGRGSMEPVVYEESDGRIVMLIRTDQNSLYYSESRDQGENWGSASSTGIQSPQAPCMVTTLEIAEEGYGFLCWNERLDPDFSHGGPRNPLYLGWWKLTEGYHRMEGRSIVNESAENEKTYAYPSIYAEGNKLWITYYESEDASELNLNEGTNKSLRLSCFEIDCSIAESTKPFDSENPSA